MPSSRVENLLTELTDEEKVSLVSGADWWHTPPVDRLGIPPFKMTDGPNGARGANFSGGPPSACFPCGTALASTWDPELIERVGVELAKEVRSKGAHLLLAPTVNLHRTPLAGRNFECFSEDPFLAARMAVAYIRGVQSEGVGTTVKHFVANDSEYERMSISSEVPERALRELYLVPFEAAVTEAGSWAIMSGYNRVHGTYCSEHPGLLTTILRDEWGFDGLVVSDWFGTHSTAPAANAGLDLEMPGPPLCRGDALLAVLSSGEVGADVLDRMTGAVLTAAERSGALDEEPRQECYDDDPARGALLREVAGAAIVLLRNEPLGNSGKCLLPLDANALRRVAVIGPTAANPSIQGGGSAQVPAPASVSPLDALREALGDGVEVVHEPGAWIGRSGSSHLDITRLRSTAGDNGLGVQYFGGADVGGDPVQSEVSRRSSFRWNPDFAPGGHRGRWSARISADFMAVWTGHHEISIRTSGHVRMWVGDSVAIDAWNDAGTRRTVAGAVELEAGATTPLRIEYAPHPSDTIPTLDVRAREPVPTDLAGRAASAAAAADVAIVVVGLDSTWETEGFDRSDLSLPGRQAELIELVAQSNPRTVVVVNAGSPVDMAWTDRVPAVLQLWYPGQEGGHALADILFGAAEPAGRLPTTFPVRLEDVPAMLNYPGEQGEVRYGEGLFVGYRAFDRTGVAPRFAFGHGLSYTTFRWDAPTLSTSHASPGVRVVVEVQVTNTGSRSGVDVVQVYVADREASVLRPPKELKGFARLRLGPGETATARIELDDRAFAFWDPQSGTWTVEPGEFDVIVAASATDIRGLATIVWSA